MLLDPLSQAQSIQKDLLFPLLENPHLRPSPVTWRGSFPLTRRDWKRAGGNRDDGDRALVEYR